MIRLLAAFVASCFAFSRPGPDAAARRFRQGHDRHLGILQRRARQDLHRHLQERARRGRPRARLRHAIAPRCFRWCATSPAGNIPQDDLLHLLDAQGKALIEFSEVEDGIYEAPTPGLGVLFLQAPGAAAGPAPMKPEQVAGDWALKRGEGKPLCLLALTQAPAHDGFALTVQPGCDAGIAKLGFAQWRIDSGQLELMPARGEPWRFEEIDDVTWRRLPDRPDQLTLVKQ